MSNAPLPPLGRALAGLGDRLRTLREATGLTGTAFATALGPAWRQSKISKIENGRQLPTAADLADWAHATGTEATALSGLRAKAAAEYASSKERIDAAGGPLALQDELTALARSCTFLAEFQAVLLPGRLQTPAYMREKAQGNDDLPGLGITPDVLDHIIAAKLRRQSILYEPGREIVHVLTEGVLRTRFGAMTVETQRTQLRHLAELAALPRHTLGILPFTVPLPVQAAEFQLYDHDLVVVESVAGSLQITDPDAVARYVGWFDRLRELALTGEDAARFCRDLAGSL